MVRLLDRVDFAVTLFNDSGGSFSPPGGAVWRGDTLISPSGKRAQRHVLFSRGFSGLPASGGLKPAPRLFS